MFGSCCYCYGFLQTTNRKSKLLSTYDFHQIIPQKQGLCRQKWIWILLIKRKIQYWLLDIVKHHPHVWPGCQSTLGDGTSTPARPRTTARVTTTPACERSTPTRAMAPSGCSTRQCSEWGLELQTMHRFQNRGEGHIQGLLLGKNKPTSVSTFKTLLKHYSKQALTDGKQT